MCSSTQQVLNKCLLGELFCRELAVAREVLGQLSQICLPILLEVKVSLGVLRGKVRTRESTTQQGGQSWSPAPAHPALPWCPHTRHPRILSPGTASSDTHFPLLGGAGQVAGKNSLQGALPWLPPWLASCPQPLTSVAQGQPRVEDQKRYEVSQMPWPGAGCRGRTVSEPCDSRQAPPPLPHVKGDTFLIP